MFCGALLFCILISLVGEEQSLRLIEFRVELKRFLLDFDIFGGKKGEALKFIGGRGSSEITFYKIMGKRGFDFELVCCAFLKF